MFNFVYRFKKNPFGTGGTPMTHGTSSRQPAMLKSPANRDTGLFGRMFEYNPNTVGEASLLKLAAAMKNTAPIDNPKIPAGFTYLGQFIDHDITLDLTSLSEQADDKIGVENFRTPTLDLDSVYGLGIEGSPHLYQRDPQTFRTSAKLLLGRAAESVGPPGLNPVPERNGFDLPRNTATGTALIGDPRNDENLLVAQIHVAFLRFHNAVVTKLQAEHPTWKAEELFKEARQLVTWHYQWLVLHEFLGKLTGDPNIADNILRRGRRHYRFAKFPFMPIEFSIAAYRLGHSMIREEYSHNIVFRPDGAFGENGRATLLRMFQFTGKSGQIIGDLVGPPVDNPPPLPTRTLPSNWVVDWRRFFEFGTPAGTPNFEFNHAQKLDPFIVPALHSLPGFAPGDPQGVLPFRNLKRSRDRGLPSGQSVAKEIDIAPLTPAQIGKGPDGAVAAAEGMLTDTPLWYYILKEAEQLGGSAPDRGGEHLGPVGATIVAETFVGLVQGSPGSYLNASSAFVPSLGAVSGEFTMVDLLKFAKFVNPVEEANPDPNP
jgi:hypothetical protein